jgi:autotransporter passenger strand-loop-strand repeat protein
MIESGGVASGTLLDDNNTQFVYGIATGTVVSAGDAQIVEAGGFAIGTVVSSGGSEFVSAGGTAISTAVNSGGSEVVSAGGGDFNAVLSGGVQDLFGTANGTLLLAGGVQTVEAGGTASATVLDAGASQLVFGAAVGTIVSAGDIAIVEAGGSAVSPTIAGGTLELTPSGQVSGAIAFTGTGGVLQIDGAALPSAAITGFTTGDTIDLRGLSVNSLSYSGGVLTLNQSAQLGVFTPFAKPVFSTAADGSGGTLITVAGAAPLGPTSLYDFLYMYGDGKDYYYGMVADNGTFGYQVGQQIATPDGHYTIFNNEGTTTDAVGSVSVSYYSHGGVGEASTTPLKFAEGLPAGLAGLGSETDSSPAPTGWTTPSAAPAK